MRFSQTPLEETNVASRQCTVALCLAGTEGREKSGHSLGLSLKAEPTRCHEKKEEVDEGTKYVFIQLVREGKV